MPRERPGVDSGRPRDTRDIWADLCGNSHSRGRMSAGQMTGQMGHVHGTDGTQTKVSRQNSLCLLVFFLSPAVPPVRLGLSGRNPGNALRAFLEFPPRVRLGSPKPYNSRHLKPPEHFPNCLAFSTAGDTSFFRSGSGEGLSELLMEFPAVVRAFLTIAITNQRGYSWY